MSPMIPEKKKDKPLAIEPITHPRKELLEYQVKQILAILEEEGLI